MDNKLARQARFNSILLGLMFGLSTIRGLGDTSATGIIMTIFGILATVSTIKDAVNFNKAIKEK